MASFIKVTGFQSAGYEVVAQHHRQHSFAEYRSRNEERFSVISAQLECDVLTVSAGIMAAQNLIYLRTVHLFGYSVEVFFQLCFFLHEIFHLFFRPAFKF